MPNFESSRRLSVSSGDGQTSQETTPTVTVNKQFKPARRGERINLSAQTKKQPVSASYTNRTTAQIVDEQFNEADKHSKKIKGQREIAYMVIEIIKFALVTAMSWGGGTFAANWTPAVGFEVLPGIKFASVILFAIGPWFAYALSYFLKVGVFSGVSKKIAWLIIITVIIEEALALRAMRNTDFANWLMTELAPYSLAAMLIGIVSLAYLRSDLKRKRDLAEMKASEEDMLAKNATDARMMKGKKERRSRTVEKMGQFVAHKVKSGYSAVMVVPYAVILNISSAHRETVDAVKSLNKPAKKKTTSQRVKK